MLVDGDASAVLDHIEPSYLNYKKSKNFTTFVDNWMGGRLSGYHKETITVSIDEFEDSYSEFYQKWMNKPRTSEVLWRRAPDFVFLLAFQITDENPASAVFYIGTYKIDDRWYFAIVD